MELEFVSASQVLAAPEGSPFAHCMSCGISYPSETEVCGSCELPTSIVRDCVQCGRIVSSKHSQCPYCGCRFVPLVVETEESYAGLVPQQGGRQRLKTLIVCSFVFCVVATVAYKFNAQYRGVPATIGTSYALHDMKIYQRKDFTDPHPGMVASQGTIDITGFDLSRGEHGWMEVQSTGISRYVHPSDVAPPRVRGDNQGYLLLKGYLAGVSDPSVVASQAAEAIDRYRHESQSDVRADELDWMLMERLRTTKDRPEVFRVEKLEYGRIASRPGEFQQQARTRLAELSTR